MGELNTTPNANRLHIGIFGRTNSGKSTFINAFTGQQVSIVAEVAGTTTDPVYKAMEVHPLGPCVIMDTAGLEDDTQLGSKRRERTELVMDKADIAVVVFPLGGGNDEAYYLEKELVRRFQKDKIPTLCLINCFEGIADEAIDRLSDDLCDEFSHEKCEVFSANCKTGDRIKDVRRALTKLMPEDFGQQFITGELVAEDDLVLLVMPQDIQAPKNRLILPQVQTIRELLDRKCTVVCTTVNKFLNTLEYLKDAPKLIITDSQVFGYVYENKPAKSNITSFSVLFAAYKGDLACYVQGAGYIDKLTENSRILIAECCTHAPLAEDIGRVKIPNMLRKRFGAGLSVDVVSGTDFPADLTAYDLIIQCGGCMFNRNYVLSRIQRAKEQNVPITNYGITIAHITGILDKISM